MGKRSHGEGSISKRNNGTWLAQVSIEGRRVSKTFKTRKEALEWVTATTRQVKHGLTYSSAKTTLDELLESWLILKKNKLRPATEEFYRRLSRLYISPFMGKLKLQEITAARIQAFYEDMERRGIGKRTIEGVHITLHGLLSHAHRLGLVAQNWAALVEVPRPEHREMSVWDESQVSQFLMTIRDNPFYRLAFATGMRRGELIGLQWKDIDWNTGMIQVRRQVYEPEGGGFIFQPPKTERGRRAIRLGRGLIESLRSHFTETIPRMVAIAGETWNDYDLVFPCSNGKPRNGYNVSKEFRELCTRAGLPVIRFHDIRHTAASIMLLHGEPPVRVAAILGQSVAVLLSTYAHYIQDDQERASRLMDEITTPASIEIQSEKIATDCNN
ncbi:MAG TPA: tyrosine-type recombinase/integrase [Anaerolineaceae bacterium]|nr:tyrosine-type recombinase/integrase [Anaerolineaceae bacterium]